MIKDDDSKARRRPPLSFGVRALPRPSSPQSLLYFDRLVVVLNTATCAPRSATSCQELAVFRGSTSHTHRRLTGPRILFATAIEEQTVLWDPPFILIQTTLVACATVVVPVVLFVRDSKQGKN